MLALMSVKDGWMGFEVGGIGQPPIYVFFVIPGLSSIGGGGWAICIEVLSDTFGIMLGCVGDIALEDIEDSAKEDSGDGMFNVVRFDDDILLAALSTMHCWQLEL